ncbi:MAG: hypothetical protein ACOX69_04850 [Coriobacteriales bacterium]|jgi:Fe-S-cluster-containing dehydrogenase component
MTQYGLLIDYEYCSGCQSCEVTCKESHNYPVGKWGIRVLEEGPWEIEDGTGIFDYNYIPVPTDLCDLCKDRTAKGKEPLCVHHCLANVITYGTTEELAKKMAEKNKQVLWAPQYKPIEAKGPFVPDKKSNNEGRSVEHVEIEENDDWSTAAHRRSDDDHFEFGIVE